jgi:vacuolar-type H+-ATPase subunit H
MAEQPQQDATARAEAIVDDLLGRAQTTAAKWIALAREEAEDIWAEAQALRRRQGAGAGQGGPPEQPG